MQSLNITQAGVYFIFAYGASGGARTSEGSTVCPGPAVGGIVVLDMGDQLAVIVGGRGNSTDASDTVGAPGGGGGTFIFLTNVNVSTPIVTAGGSLSNPAKAASIHLCPRISRSAVHALGVSIPRQHHWPRTVQSTCSACTGGGGGYYSGSCFTPILSNATSPGPGGAPGPNDPPSRDVDYDCDRPIATGGPGQGGKRLQIASCAIPGRIIRCHCWY